MTEKNRIPPDYGDFGDGIEGMVVSSGGASYITSDINILTLHDWKKEGIGRVRIGKMPDKNYFCFSHNLATWKLCVATTESQASKGGGRDDLLFAANGHYKGWMTDKMSDDLLGMASALYLLGALPQKPAQEP